MSVSGYRLQAPDYRIKKILRSVLSFAFLKPGAHSLKPALRSLKPEAWSLFFAFLKPVACSLLFLLSGTANAHHVLGRPAYSLNEDSNTPPSMQVETQIGDYFVTYMVFPAFPRPNQPGRINLYAKRMDDNKPFTGNVTFKVRDDSWFHKNEETLGVQPPIDNVYRQNFEFLQKGDYIISATFEAGGAPYIIDFPLRIGKPAAVGPIGIAVAVIITALLSVNLIQRKRLLRARISSAHEGKRK